MPKGQITLRPCTTSMWEMFCEEQAQPVRLSSCADDKTQSAKPIHNTSQSYNTENQTAKSSKPQPPRFSFISRKCFSAVLAEHRSELSYEPENGMENGSQMHSVDAERLQAASNVLRLLYDSPAYDSLIRRYYQRTWVTITPNKIIESVLCSMRLIFDGFDPDNNNTQFQDFANQMFYNSSRSLTTRGSMTVEEYCASFTGRYFRWEALGNVFAVAGLSLMPTPDNDPTFVKKAADPQAKEELLAQVLEASGICLSFCDQAASSNELLGFFQYNDLMLRTQQYGDSSHQAWRRLGDLTAMIYAAGLHQEINLTDDCPFFLRQWRRSCFAAAFYADKTIATFVGRPPLMNYRYCTLTSPLDLSEEVLLTGGNALTQAVAKLDMAGWDTEGNRHRISFPRLRYLLSIFREEALEIALGTFPLPEIVETTSRILEKARTTWEATPNHLRYDRQVKPACFEPVHIPFTILLVYLDYLHSCFLLQRSLVKRANAGQEDLFQTSRQLLGVIIKISAERDPLIDLSRHYSWIVLYYGLPSASVLTLELLRQTQEIEPQTVKLPRAEIIRNLSVFVSCLSWVARPTHGNYHMCREAEKKLSHFLNQILDPQPVQGEIFDDATSDLDHFLNWYTFNNWDFNSELLS
ncbi:hypothetical protein PT974_00419 [Cladobotryum mycophilum]|uniref:Xylanolytic transcriptional activator regulatory domain-containing protein n=1 Tax=Cladobotryum mycophilum TaxID=491253 RepID=A0ABR0T110_9HYPO